MTFANTRSGRRVVLARRPNGPPVAGDFRIEEVDPPDLRPGEIRIASKFLSIDPYVRCLLDETSPYGPTLGIGAQIVGDAVSVVTSTTDGDFPVGTWVIGRTGWSTHANVSTRAVRRVEDWVADPTVMLSSLGNTGLTAFIGITKIGLPALGDVALVSGAAGGVGSIAAQLLKLSGSDVIAIAGGARKTAFLRDELGIAKVIDYQATRDLAAAILALAPNGIDLYFDNVGGSISEAALPNLATGARVVLCGEASQYNVPGQEQNPRLYGPLMAKRASIAGFLVSDFASDFAMMRQRLNRLIVSGKLKDVRDVVDGIENAPGALIGMMSGDNLGKRIVRIND
jgi:NADPH-dependent curcumin reductase